MGLGLLQADWCLGLGTWRAGVVEAEGWEDTPGLLLEDEEEGSAAAPPDDGVGVAGLKGTLTDIERFCCSTWKKK